MTELLTRTQAAATRVGERAAASSVWVRGALAALWAVSVGAAVIVVLVLLVWAADPRSGASAVAAIRTALDGWLLAQHVPLRADGGSLAVAPLGLTLGFGFLVARAAAVLAREQDVTGGSGVATTALAVGVPYGVLATFVAAAANSTVISPQPVAALVAGTVVGCTAAAWGAARGAGVVADLWRRLPPWLRVPTFAGAAAVGVLAAAALVVTLASLALHLSTANDLAASLGGGLVGLAALVAVDAVLLPNAAVCGIAYLAGPGFAIGSGTSFTMSGVRVHDVPALPLLGALPHAGAPAVLQAAAIVVVLGAGGLAGWLVRRNAPSMRRSLALAGGAGAAAAIIGALLAAVAGGPAGPGRMAAVGPSPWQTGLALGGEVALVACLSVAVLSVRSRTDS